MSRRWVEAVKSIAKKMWQAVQMLATLAQLVQVIQSELPKNNEPTSVIIVVAQP